MENQHEKIEGYRDLNIDEIDAMNQLKALEKKILSKLEEINEDPNDKRAIALAKTNIQQGFMWAVRAVARPGEAK